MELDAASQLVTVAGHRIPYLLCGDTKTIWFQAKPLAELLDYSDTAAAIRDNVRPLHRRDFQTMKDVYGSAKVISRKVDSGSTLQIHPQTVYVDEPGLWALFMRSNKPEAEAIQEWVTVTVLPTIRATGSYSMNSAGPTDEDRQLERAEKRQRLAKGAMEVFHMMEAQKMTTSTDRLMFADITRNTMMPFSTLPAIRGSTSSDQPTRMMLPLSDIYKEVTGKQGTKKILMALGKQVAKEYRERHDGAQPEEAERFIDGTTRYVKTYSPMDDPWVKDVVQRLAIAA